MQKVSYDNRTKSRWKIIPKNVFKSKREYIIHLDCSDNDNVDEQINEQYQFFEKQKTEMVDIAKTFEYIEVESQDNNKEVLFYFEIESDAYDKTKNDSLIYYSDGTCKLKLDGTETFYEVTKGSAEVIIDNVVSSNKEFYGSDKKPCYVAYDWSDWVDNQPPKHVYPN